MSDYIALKDCVKGTIYRLRSRNLNLGVYDGDNGFIGVREKFGERYLFTEYHWDQGAPFGTVHPLEVIGQLPASICLFEYHPTVDMRNGRPAEFDRPVADGGRGWYYTDTGESDQDMKPTVKQNDELYKYMEQLEKEHAKV